MALFDDVLKGNTATGLAIGVGATILVPIVLPVLAGVTRPVAKALIKAGVIGYGKSREAIAELAEVVEDLVAEAKAELATDTAHKTVESAEGAPSEAP